MRKLFISTSVALALGLTGCGGSSDTIDDIEAETPTQAPFSRIVFNPSAGELNIPNDLLMLPGDDGFFDYTLNIPVDDPDNFADPQNALNVLDGWSTQQPFVINVNTPSGVSLDESTLADGIFLYEATLGLDQSDPDCATAEFPSSGCKLGDQLQYGVDYVLSLADEDTVTVVPLHPLKSAQGYMLLMTTDLKDSEGNGVRGSSNWELVRQDIETLPLSTDSQLAVQSIVNSFVNLFMEEGWDREEISYVSAFTTQSTAFELESIKQVMVAEYGARAAAGDPSAAEALPAVVVSDAAGPDNAMETLGLVDDDVLAGAVQMGIDSLTEAQQAFIPTIESTLADGGFDSLQTCSGLIGTASGQLSASWGQLNEFAMGIAGGILEQAGAFCAASRFEGEISLPYYLPIPTAENPRAPLTGFWQAACDSGFVLGGASDEVLASATPGPNNSFCQQIELADLRVNGERLDTARNITRYNPIPQPMGGNQGNETLDVQITVPNPVAAAALDVTIAQPESGWPVAILSHGIGRSKEDMLAITGALSLAGIATVAIDHPLHGSRGFDLNGDGTDDINATSVSPTVYMNLQSLPTARDNLRQSVTDLLGLRLGLNGLMDTTNGEVTIDASNVSFMGVSLGAIAGVNFAAVANTPMQGELAPLSDLFAVEQASLESPGGGVARFLMDSPRFGPLIKGLLLSQSSEAFQALLMQMYETTEVSQEQLVAAVGTFLKNLTSAQQAEVNAVFNEFTFAAQTVLDSGDPNNFAQMLGNDTPVHMMTVVGDGGETNLPDQVIPVTTSQPLAGQLPLAQIIGLEQVSSTVTGDPVSGHVHFTQGAHGSSLSPEASAAVTTEMQREVAAYLSSGATIIPITNTDVVAN